VLESSSPLLITRKSLSRDSGGPGRYRGGLGQRIDVEVTSGEPFIVSALADRIRFGADGYAGGRSGGRGGFLVGGRRRNPKLSVKLPAGTRFTLLLPGGGGTGKPEERAREKIEEDLAEGLISVRAAAEAYAFEAEAP